MSLTVTIEPLETPAQAEIRQVKYVVIVARFKQQWLLVRQHGRDSLEIPGGKVEPGESPLQAARRELIEETGASRFTLTPLSFYQVSDTAGPCGSGLLCYADVSALGELPPGSEMAEVTLCDQLPEIRQLSWPLIQPQLFDHALQRTRLLHRLQAYQHVIWDWNGTLVDDSPLATGIVNHLLAEQGLAGISHHEYQQGFCHPIEEYYRQLGFDYSRLSYPELCHRFGKAYSAGRDELQLHPGSRFLLQAISGSEQINCQSILTASAQSSLEQCLQHHEIDHWFDHAYGQHDNLALSKLARGEQLIEASGVAPGQTVMLGDTDHDIEVAQALGVDLILIADGHQDFQRLSSWHHDVLPGWAHAV